VPFAIGIDLGGTDIKGAIVSPSGDILHQDRTPTEASNGPDAVADRIASLAKKLCNDHGSIPSDAIGLGIGVPGVTRADGTVVLAPNLDWHHVPFKTKLQERLPDTPIEIDNDANVAALAEAKAGIGAGCHSLVFLTLGTGIGGGVVIDGAIHHGASHSAGEIGHMTVLPDGPLCGCGKHGCLEALSATKGMIGFAQQGLDAGETSVLVHIDTLTPKTICDAAGQGDALALATVNHVADYIGIAIANLLHVLSPDVVAIGGGISAAGDILLNPIIESAKINTLEGLFESTTIGLAKLGNNAGSIGAAYLVR
jgi:glucokinase